MPPIAKPKILSWTLHAQAKMNFYKLSPQRVRRVLNAPKRVEEGVAPKTVAMMQPASLKNAAGRAGGSRAEKWTQEIWVMFQDSVRERRVISAWRYPGVTKPRDEAALRALKKEYNDFINDTHEPIV